MYENTLEYLEQCLTHSGGLKKLKFWCFCIFCTFCLMLYGELYECLEDLQILTDKYLTMVCALSGFHGPSMARTCSYSHRTGFRLLETHVQQEQRAGSAPLVQQLINDWLLQKFTPS